MILSSTAEGWTRTGEWCAGEYRAAGFTIGASANDGHRQSSAESVPTPSLFCAYTSYGSDIGHRPDSRIHRARGNSGPFFIPSYSHDTLPVGAACHLA